MLEILGYFFGEIIIGCTLLYPGASILYLFSFKKRKFQDILKQQKMKSIVIGFFIFTSAIIYSCNFKMCREISETSYSSEGFDFNNTVNKLCEDSNMMNIELEIKHECSNLEKYVLIVSIGRHIVYNNDFNSKCYFNLCSDKDYLYELVTFRIYDKNTKLIYHFDAKDVTKLFNRVKYEVTLKKDTDKYGSNVEWRNLDMHKTKRDNGQE